jgi:hypothetical protein
MKRRWVNTAKLIAGLLTPVAAALTAMDGWPNTPQEIAALLMALLGSIAGVSYTPKAKASKLEMPDA